MLIVEMPSSAPYRHNLTVSGKAVPHKTIIIISPGIADTVLSSMLKFLLSCKVLTRCIMDTTRLFLPFGQKLHDMIRGCFALLVRLMFSLFLRICILVILLIYVGFEPSKPAKFHALISVCKKTRPNNSMLTSED